MTTWRGPLLGEEQRDLANMLRDLASNRPAALSDDPATVGDVIAQLVELGVWTLGVSEQCGGGGADHVTTSVALSEVSRAWPAIGLAMAQAHIASEMLAADSGFADVVHEIHAGRAVVAVVDTTCPHVRLTRDADRLHGVVDRVDPGGASPHLLVLDGSDGALLVDSSAVRPSPLARTGLGGAFTSCLAVDADTDAVRELTGVDVPAARARLRVGVAAVAAGIASASVDAATEYAAGRQQFGGPLTAIATVRQSLLAQATRTALVLDAVLAASDADPVRAFACVQSACEGAIEVATAALQVHGGYGYLAEYPVERHLRDAISLRAAAALPGAAVSTASYLVGRGPTKQLLRETS